MIKEQLKQELTAAIEDCDKRAADLMFAALALVEIIDQPIDENGMIKVQYQFASKKIHVAQLTAKSAADELDIIKDAVNSYLKED